MADGDAYVFPGFLTPVLTQLFFPKPSTTFLTCFCRSERQKYAGKKSCLNRGSNSQLPGHPGPTRSPLSHPGGALTLLLFVIIPFILRRKKSKFSPLILLCSLPLISNDETRLRLSFKVFGP